MRIVEQIAVGDDEVGDLALVDRTHARVSAGDLRCVERQRAKCRVGRETGTHRARRVADELAGLTQTRR